MRHVFGFARPTREGGPRVSRVFINYRREDTGMSVGRLADDLRDRLPLVEVFQDIDSIAPGADFIEALQQALDDCAAVLVVIGPKWISLADHRGQRLLDAPDDWVRQEIVAALQRPGVRVFPVLVEGALMPSEADLPDDVKPLHRRQAHELTVRHWGRDVDDLVQILLRVPALAAQAAGDEGRQLQPRASLTAGDASVPGLAASAARLPASFAWRRSVALGLALMLALGGVLWFLVSRDEGLPREARVPAPDQSASPPASVERQITSARDRPAAAASSSDERSVPAAHSFRDCERCPEMVEIPAGHFAMGSPAAEAGRFENEGPQHPVEIARFALGRGEVTVGEFRRFVEATGYRTEAERSPAEGMRAWDTAKAGWAWLPNLSWRAPGFAQDDSHPVVGVSWNDAMAYLKWLAHTTGKHYRLPSESEWEYAARAGTRTSRMWGENANTACAHANVADRRLKAEYADWPWLVHECVDGYAHTAPTGRFAPNAFGLLDMIGNVWEWTLDCWNETYLGAPADGRAWLADDCGHRVMRGAAWNYEPRVARSATRFRGEPGFRGVDVGFRVARAL